MFTLNMPSASFLSLGIPYRNANPEEKLKSSVSEPPKAESMEVATTEETL